jgi:cellulose synthase/poly-beta-1,6-N-acetylglucosamine synthase-like glycosyltransferase
VVILFWLLAALAVYPYVIYPVLVTALSWAFGRNNSLPSADDDALPSVSILIVAHNEEKFIRSRLENALATRYPSDKLEIVIASDGSTDATVRIVEEFAAAGVKCLDFTERRGKTAALRAAAEEVRGDVVILSDANSFFRQGAVKAMASWFLKPSVGVVCGRLVLADDKNNKNCDGLYWRIETWLKQCESRLGALLGTNGAIYAIRRELLRHLPSGAIVDDFELPLTAKLHTGCDLVFESSAVADEETAPGIANEFGRRARIGAGAFQSLERLYPLLNPARGWISLTFISHKVLRWMGPFVLVGVAAANVALLDQPFYVALMWLQSAFYIFALIGLLMPVGAWPKFARLPTLFVTVNLALLCGFYRWLFGRGSAVWEPTRRTDPMASVVA